MCNLASLDTEPPAAPGDASLSDAMAWGTCDGVDDCTAAIGYAADEVGCATNACVDGSPYPDGVICDGFQDCPSGSDELGCGP